MLASLSTSGILAIVVLIAVLLPFVHLRSSVRVLQRHLEVVLGLVLVCGGLLYCAVIADSTSRTGLVKSAVVERSIGRFESDTREQDLFTNWWNSSSNLQKLFGNGYGTYTFATSAGYFTNSGFIRLL